MFWPLRVVRIRFVQIVNDKAAARLEDARDFGERRRNVGEIFERVDCVRRVEACRLKRQLGAIRFNEATTVGDFALDKICISNFDLKTFEMQTFAFARARSRSIGVDSPHLRRL